MPSKWNLESVLRKGRARTRDGRAVFNLRLATIEGKDAIIGDVAVHPEREVSPVMTVVWWGRGGLSNGTMDLVQETRPEADERKRRVKRALQRFARKQGG